MDLEYELTTLVSKQSELESLKNIVNEINAEFNSSTINKLSSTEISSIASKLKSSIERLNNAYTNCSNWFSNFNSELNELETSLTSLKGKNGATPESFKLTFSDLFTKVTVPLWTTAKQNERKEQKVDNSSDDITDNSSIEAKRKAFIGDINDTSKYYIDPKYPNMQKDLRCFNNQTGEEIFDNQTIHLKVGETITLTIALPYNAGVPKRIIRTTAADVSSQTDKYKITSSKSNISGDPNNIQYVNYQYNHWPSGVDLHTNYYEWVIHADKPGSRQISQTCEYESSAGIPKSMIGINVVID